MAARRSVFDRMGSTGRNGGIVSDETLNAKVGPPVRNNGVRNYADVLRGGSQGVVQEKEVGSKPVIVLDQECVDAEGEDDVFMNHGGDDMANYGRSDDDDGESVHVPDSFDNDNREGAKSPLDDDPFGLDDLICKKGDVNNCCSKEMANDISFPPGFTPPFVARKGAVHVECQERPTQQHSPHTVPSPDSVGGMRTKPHVPGSSMNFREGDQDDDCQSVISPLDGVFGTQSANADSMIPPKPPVDALSLMDQFNRFIEMG
ncbi:hypothetical protein L1887_01925 [Cichorium endivia]|nr:hypothetical protein L1887_01925 [Cichorium endivia]